MQRLNIETTLGNIEIEIDDEAAPKTSANFLQYVDSEAYDGGSFYRTVTTSNQPNDSIRIEVIQGGKHPDYSDDVQGNLPLERTSATGLKHLDGTISMARFTPDSAKSEFFICINDQPDLDFGGLRNPDGQGFAAFGKVLSGMDVVNSIHQQPVEEQTLTPVIPILKIERT